jgi:hypothetical protein
MESGSRNQNSNRSNHQVDNASVIRKVNISLKLEMICLDEIEICIMQMKNVNREKKGEVNKRK